MIKSIAVAALAATCVSAYQAPSAFFGNGLKAQSACRSSGIHMSAADDASVSRRAALGAILAGAVAVPGAAFASYNSEKGRDSNWQLKDNGVMTGVVSSSMSGTRVSGFGAALIGNNEKAKTLPRNEITDGDLKTLDSLTNKVLKESAIAKKGYKTSNKIGINPAFGGSSGIFTGAE